MLTRDLIINLPSSSLSHPGLVTNADRLVLIQPNLRFFHELFGWEVELAREEEAIIEQRRKEMQATGMVDEEALKALEENKRRICYSFPTFCRDLVSRAHLP